MNSIYGIVVSAVDVSKIPAVAQMILLVVVFLRFKIISQKIQGFLDLRNFHKSLLKMGFAASALHDAFDKAVVSNNTYKALISQYKLNLTKVIGKINGTHK